MDRFFAMAERSGGTVGYQTLINAAIRVYLEGKAPKFEDTLRCIIREELKSSGWYTLVRGTEAAKNRRQSRRGCLTGRSP